MFSVKKITDNARGEENKGKGKPLVARKFL